MKHIEINSVTINQNESTATIADSGLDLTIAESGWLLFIQQDGLMFTVESGGNQSLELTTNSPYTDLTARKALLIETVSHANATMDKLALITDTVRELSQTREDVFTSDQETIEWIDAAGTVHTISTQKRYENLIQNVENLSHSLTAQRSVTAKAVGQALKGVYPYSGFVSMGLGRDVGYPNGKLIQAGLWARTVDSYIIKLGYPVTGSGVVGTSNTPYPVFNVNSVLMQFRGVNYPNSNGENSIKLPPAADGLQKSDGTGNHTDLAAAVIAGGNDLSASNLHIQNLVTVRSKTIDLGQYGYPLGNRQYGASTFTCEDGTVINLINNPTQSECRMYDNNWFSDTTTLGKVVDLDAITDAEKASFVADSRNNISNKPNGGLEQVVYQAFTHSCIGHYHVISPADTRTIMLAEGFAATNDFGLYTKDGWNYIPVGFQESALNQGAYHPVYNKLGTSTWWTADGTTSSTRHWHDTDYIPTETVDCFSFRSQGGSEVGRAAERGRISSSTSGRPDGKFYDAIYAKGFKDLRNDVNHWDESRSFGFGVNRSINGQASERAIEKEVFCPFADFTTGFVTGGVNLSGGATYLYANSLSIDGSAVGIGTITNSIAQGGLGKYVYVGANGNSYRLEAWSNASNTRVTKLVGSSFVDGDYTTELNGQSGIILGVDPRDLTGVARTYFEKGAPCITWTDIIGSPANILAWLTSIGADGLCAAWIHVIPDGTSKEYKANRKALDYLGRQVATDNGVNWSSDTQFDFVGSSNATTQTYASNAIALRNYDYAPIFTTPANQVRVDYMDGKVWAGNINIENYGVSLIQALLGKVATDYGFTTVPLNQYAIDPPTQVFSTSSSAGKTSNHGTLNLTAVDSPAVKCFFYEHTDEYGLVRLFLIFKELVYDAVDGFGDNNKFIITNGVAYGTDQNNNTIKYGCMEVDTGYRILRQPKIKEAA